jgi:hypothetical protein
VDARSTLHRRDPRQHLALQVLQHRATSVAHGADPIGPAEKVDGRHAVAATPAYLYGSMKIVVEVKDSKVEFLLELLRSLPFVKNTTVQDEKAAVLESVRTAVEQMKEVKAGKLKGRAVQKLLDEL